MNHVQFQKLTTVLANAFIGADSNTHPILIRRLSPLFFFFFTSHDAWSLTAHLLMATVKKNGDMLTYTAQGQPPTAFQNLYVIQNDVQPIALTVPHSGAAPQGANFTGFGVNDDGYFTFNGAPAFATDPAATGAKEIFYAGLPNSKYQQTMLWVKECKGC